MNMERRVVITGMGLITPIGNDVETFWTNLCAGRSGACTITHIDTDGLSSKIGAVVRDYDAEQHFDKKEARKNERFVQFAMVASRQAIQDSGFQITDENRDRVGAIIGCGIGGLQTIEEQHTVLMTKGGKRISPFLIPKIITNMAAGAVAIEMGARGPNSCIVTACASGTHSIGESYHVIKRGDADAMFAGGTEAAITAMGLAGFSNMHALTTRNAEPERASRPFDRERDGFLMGEGAGILFLEEYEKARKRGARIYAEIVGYGMSCDAYHVTAPAPDGDGAVRALRAALHSAGINPEEVDYINAHGTSTVLNDKLETLGIKTAFGDHAYKLSISSNKSMIGHLLGAAGGVEAIATALTIVRGVIPPTINYEYPDPECDLDYVPNTAREKETRVALSNSLGFGGHNCTIALKKI